jgi:N utilization substance protein B
MHPRSHGRELALQYLYMHDSLRGKDVPTLDEHLAHCAPAPAPQAAKWAGRLVEIVLASREQLDAEIARVSHNWRIARMALVDRNILRLGLAELRDCPETPYKVVIDEAVQLARVYSSEEACAFVNGILDRLGQDLKAEPPPPPAAAEQA